MIEASSLNLGSLWKSPQGQTYVAVRGDRIMLCPIYDGKRVDLAEGLAADACEADGWKCVGGFEE